MRNYDPIKGKAYRSRPDVAKRLREKALKDYYDNRDYYLDKSREQSRQMRKEIIDFLGGRCCKCGYSDIRALQIDHINGGGRADFKEYGNRYAYYKHIHDMNGEGYQVLCANCNQIKRAENREYGPRLRKEAQ